MTEQRAPISAALSGSTYGAAGVLCRAGGDFCRDLSLTAHTLERMAERRREQFPLDAFSLLCRALELLEKALSFSCPEEETHEPLQDAFLRMLQEAEAIARQVRASAKLPCGIESLQPPAQPNRLIFEYAVQQAKDAAVALSKGREAGGWEAFCHEKLSMALLLLQLLGSQADVEDLSTINSYTEPISRIVSDIERSGLSKVQS